jgi:hypothetical protein
VNRVAILALHELIRRQALQHGLTLRGVGRLDDETRRRQQVFARGDAILLCLAGADGQDTQGHGQECGAAAPGAKS